tara:strand:+ start:5 stop:1996 length:1992 start_codon:yes stop_codon:yes gene_type:complete
MKPGGLVEPGVTHYAKTYAGEKTKKYLPLKEAVSSERYKQIKFANPEMPEAKLEKAYKKLTFYQKNDLIYESKDGTYKNRSGMINPTKSKVSEYSGRLKTLKNFETVKEAGTINPETKKVFTQNEWFKINPTKRTYYLNLAKDYAGTREKQRIKYKELADEGKIKVQGYNKTPIALRGERNGMLRFLRTAAEEGNLNYKIIKQGGEIIGVYDKKADTVWRGVLLLKGYKGKNHKSIHQHPDYKKVHNPYYKTQGGKPGLFELAKEFKFTTPNETLGTYFAKYKRVPTYNEMYNFLTRPKSKATRRGYNALEKHHISLAKGLPTKNIQLTLHDKNQQAENLWKRYNDAQPNNPSYKNQKWMDRELKKINARLKVGNKILGAMELTGEKSLAAAKRETVRLFKEKLKANPQLVEEMTRLLKIAKTTKGPPRVKALQMLAYIGGAGILTSLGLNITSAEAKTLKTLETGDQTQESNLAGNLTAVAAAGTIAAKYPKEILEGGKKVLTKTGSGFEKIIRPLFIPAVDALLATTDTPLTDKKHHRDVTSTHFWLSKAFWANAMDKYGITRTVSMLKDTPDFKGKAKIARDIFLRAGINPAAVRFISSKVAWPATAAAAVYDSYKDYQRRKPHIEKVKELRKQGIVKEEEFDEKMPMFESGGIASLLKW